MKREINTEVIRFVITREKPDSIMHRPTKKIINILIRYKNDRHLQNFFHCCKRLGPVRTHTAKISVKPKSPHNFGDSFSREAKFKVFLDPFFTIIREIRLRQL